eukprot:9082065-Pyramimonas_sp.AAC.1
MRRRRCAGWPSLSRMWTSALPSTGMSTALASAEARAAAAAHGAAPAPPLPPAAASAPPSLRAAA